MASAQSDSGSATVENLLREFKQGLKRRDLETFRRTTIQSLKRGIGQIQAEQHLQRRLVDLNRLTPFLTAVEEYGTAIDNFYDSSELLNFIWTAYAHADAFNELLDVYRQLGEAMPLPSHHRESTNSQPYTVQFLSIVLENIFKFLNAGLVYFQQPLWNDLFESSKKTLKDRLLSIVSNIYMYRNHLEYDSDVLQIQPFQQSRNTADAKYKSDLERESLNRLRDIHNWLRAVDIEGDQDTLKKLREPYHGTGHWLLENRTFQDWFDPQFPAIPPLLWLSGKPGAGKTVLASVVVEEARRLASKPAVLFFYCKHEDSERDNFSAIARSLLAQLLKHDRGLIDFFYQKCCHSGEPQRVSTGMIEDLLKLGFQNCKNAYIILDGLDECRREERKTITNWFRQLIEDLPPSDADRWRCLFVSQDDGAARKDFDGLANFKIQPQDNSHDIEEYSKIEAAKLKEDLTLTDEKAKAIATQVSKAASEKELEPNAFPTEIYDAYARIMSRIQERPSHVVKADSLALLGWLVCAKRPLKWCEIQGLKAINLESQSVEFETGKFRRSPKDLCESLVEVRPDGTVELIHLTAKFFLVDRSYVDIVAQEIGMATLCVDYLNLPAFQVVADEDMVLNGDYSFVDYAVLYWVRHLEAGLSQYDENTNSDDYRLLEQLTESLDTFLDLHWNNPSSILPISKRRTHRLRFFANMVNYNKLEQAVVSTKRHLTLFGKMREEEIALNLVDIVIYVREVLERMMALEGENSPQHDIEEKYGKNLYKCPRPSCHHFSFGFSSKYERQMHQDQHNRPFRCRYVDCNDSFGFVSRKGLEDHVQKTHSTSNQGEEDFPTDQDVMNSIRMNNFNPEPQADLIAPTSSIPESESNLSDPLVPDPATDSDSGPDTTLLNRKPGRRRRTPQEIVCSVCGKTFTKQYNYKSHMLSHDIGRPHQCHICEKRFARLSDCTRHMKIHTGEKGFICGGTLKIGEPWGCGEGFVRADILRNHHKSKRGKTCIAPFLQEQEQEMIPRQGGRM